MRTKMEYHQLSGEQRRAVGRLIEWYGSRGVSVYFDSVYKSIVTRYREEVTNIHLVLIRDNPNGDGTVQYKDYFWDRTKLAWRTQMGGTGISGITSWKDVKWRKQ